VPVADLAAVGLELLRQNLAQRGLADAVGANDRELVAARERKADVVEHRLALKRLADLVDLEDELAAGALELEANERRLNVAALEIDHVDLVDRASP